MIGILLKNYGVIRVLPISKYKKIAFKFAMFQMAGLLFAIFMIE